MKFYRAPWGKPLIAMSMLCTVVCLGVAFYPHTAATPADHRFFWLRMVPVVLLLTSVFFTVLGYVLTPTEILVWRLGWSTRLPLQDLQSATAEPDAMRSAIRLLGNGGLYAFTGVYHNRMLGKFRAFVTDGARTVVLRFPGKTAVLSPDDPVAFAQNLTSLCR